MSRKPIIGKCRLCGETKKLTFEHVPPETTFNNYSVHILSGEQVIKQVSNSNSLPWDFSEFKGKIQQRGRGGYYLCGDCNSKTGQWYVPEYSKFVHIIHSGAVERMNGISVQFVGGVGLITLSEISTYPVGFTLYIDKPEIYKPEGVEITLFSDFNYDDEGEVEIIIPKLESNIFFSGDYRTKKEIENTIQENKDRQ